MPGLTMGRPLVVPACTVSIRAGSVCLALVVVAFWPAKALGQIEAELVAGGFTRPVAFVQDPSDPGVQLVVQQDGRVRVLKDGAVQAADYLDLSSVVRNVGEAGLLGLAFAPDYATSGRTFVNFSNLAGDTVIARFRRSSTDPLRADPSSRFDLRWPDGQRVIDQPFGNHNGGHLAFGPDGYLYVGMGDGGSSNDPFHNAQDPSSLLGKMLRIDVSVVDSDPEGYDVPSTNPFVGQPGVLGEIWSFGLRNPWRWSFDDPDRGGTGALVIADVGQNAWEEVNYEPAGRSGRNYGWRNREGAHDNVTSRAPFSQPLVDPIVEYSHDDGRSITGGFVYRGGALGVTTRGRYFFADFIRSRVWSVRVVVDPATGEGSADDLVEHTAELGAAATNPSSFGVDAAGELYVVSYAGRIYRLIGVEPPPSGSRPRPPGVEPIGHAIPRGSGAPVPSLGRSSTTGISAPPVGKGRRATTGPPATRPLTRRPCLALDAASAARLIDQLAGSGPGWLVITATDPDGREVSTAVWLEVAGGRVRVVC